MKIGDKVKVQYEGEFQRIEGKWRPGRVAAITKHLIIVQFRDYKEAFKKTDILSKGWTNMELWDSNNWIKVNRGVI